MSDSPVSSSPSPSPAPSSRRSGGRRQGISSSSTSAAELAEYRALIPRSEGSLYASEGKLHTERLVVTRLGRRSNDADEEASQDEAAPAITHPTQRLKEQKLRELASPKSLLRSLESVPQARWPTAEATHEWSLADEVEGILLRHTRAEEERIQGGLDEREQRRIASPSPLPEIGEAGPSRLSAESPPPRPDEGSSDEASERSSSSQTQRRIKHSPTRSLSRSPSPTPFLLPSIALAQRTLTQLFDALRTMDEAAADRRKVQIEWKDVLAALRLMHVDEEIIQRVRRRCKAIFEPEEEEEEGEEEDPQAQAEAQPDLLDTNIYRALSTSTTSSLTPKRSYASTDALLLASPLHLPALAGTHAHSHTLWSADSLLAAPAAHQLAPPPLGRKARKEASLMSEMAGKAHEGVRGRWEVEMGRRRRREEKGKGKEIEKEEDLGDDAVGKQNEEQQPAGMDVDDNQVATSAESSAAQAPASPFASSPQPANTLTAQQQASSTSFLARRPSTPPEEQRPSKRRRRGKDKNRSSDGVEPTSEGASGSSGIMPPRERSVKSSDEASSSRGMLVAEAPTGQRASEVPAFNAPGPSHAGLSHLAGPSAPPAPKAASAQSSLPIPLAHAPPPPEAAAAAAAAASRKRKKDKDKSKASTSGSSFAALQKGKKRQHGF